MWSYHDSQRKNSHTSNKQNVEGDTFSSVLEDNSDDNIQGLFIYVYIHITQRLQRYLHNKWRPYLYIIRKSISGAPKHFIYLTLPYLSLVPWNLLIWHIIVVLSVGDHTSNFVFYMKAKAVWQVHPVTDVSANCRNVWEDLPLSVCIMVQSDISTLRILVTDCKREGTFVLQCFHLGSVTPQCCLWHFSVF